MRALGRRSNHSCTLLYISVTSSTLFHVIVQRISAENALKHPYFTTSPLPMPRDLLPTFPARSELGRALVKKQVNPHAFRILEERGVPLFLASFSHAFIFL